MSLPRILLLAALALAAQVAAADSRRVTGYGFDAAGNVVGIQSSVSNAPPVVTVLDPAFVRIGAPVRITAFGTDLRNAQVTSPDPALVVRVAGSTDTTITLDLEAREGAPLGVVDLTFRTGLGATTEPLTIQPRAPELRLMPSPPALAVGQTLPLALTLTNADLFDHTLRLATTDPSVASVSPASLTIPAGATESASAVVLTGHALGRTVLQLASPSLASEQVPIFVTTRFVPPLGENGVFARPLTVRKAAPPPPATLLARGPFSALLRVRKGAGPAPGPAGAIAVRAVPLRVGRGPLLAGLAPGTYIQGAGTRVMQLTGQALDRVTTLAARPPDGVVLNGYAPGPDGTTASLSITVTADAPAGPRQLLLGTAGGALPAVPGGDRFAVARGVPVIEAIDPVVVTRATSRRTLTVTGRHLDGATAVALLPPDGVITAANLTVNPEGTRARIDLAVSEDAPLGPRVVQLITGAGSSSAGPSPTNTLEVVNGPVITRTPITAAGLVVRKGGLPAPPAVPRERRSRPLRVAKGSVMTGLTPSAAAIGTTLTVQVQGQGLAAVERVEVQPGDGLILGPVTPAAGGTGLSVPLTIAADAPTVLRQVRLLTASGEIPVGRPGADRLRVTAPLPVIEATSPSFLILGAAPATLRVFGQNLGEVLAIEVLPPDGVAIGPPQAAPDARSVSFEAAAAAGATPGPRALRVRTAAGESPASAAPGNTLTLAAQVLQTVSPVVAPALLVAKGGAGGPPTPALPAQILAPLLRIERPVSAAPATFARAVRARPLRVARGPVGEALIPAAVPIGRSVTLEVQGAGLQGVTDLVLEPADGVLVAGAPAVRADGSGLTVPITLAPDAPQGLRRVVLATPFAPVPFAVPARGRLRIVGETPILESLSPVQEAQGAAFTLTVRGLNLAAVTGVRAVPAAGLDFAATPSVDPTGSALTLAVTIAPDAAPGPRVIVLDTPAGSSPSAAVPGNTFTVAVP